MQTIIARNRGHLSQDAISHLETASQYQASVRETCYRLTEICDNAQKLRPGINPSVLEFWKREWEKQGTRAGEYNSAAEKFALLEMEEKGRGTRSQEWKDQFDVVVEKMELWATKMREILLEEGLKILIAGEGEVKAGEAVKSV